jgi:uncharacterized protein with PIN domain
MKVIREGKASDEKWFAKCIRCNAVVEAVTSELQITQGDYRSDCEDFSWAACPACGADHALCFHKEGTRSAESDLGR